MFGLFRAGGPGWVVRLPAFTGVFAAATATGVFLDGSQSRPPTGEPDPRLLGAWVRDSDGGQLELNSDGSAACVALQTTRDRLSEDEVSEPACTEVPSAGQFRPAGPGVVKMIFPESPEWTPVRYAIDGDRLTLIRDDGGVDHYTRVR